MVFARFDNYSCHVANVVSVPEADEVGFCRRDVWPDVFPDTSCAVLRFVLVWPWRANGQC